MVTRRSLAFRLTATLAGVWLGLFVLLGGLLWHSTLRLMQEAQADKAQALATQLATVSLDAVLMRDYGTLERYLADLAGTSPSVAFVEIRRADGQVLGRVGTRAADLPLERAPMRVEGGRMHEMIGEVVTQYDPSPTQRAAWQLAGLLAVALAGFAVLTFWALRRLLLHRLVAPVSDLIRNAAPAEGGSLLSTLPVDAPQEVAALAETLSALHQRIGQYVSEAESAAQSRNEALRRLCSEQRLAAVGQIAGEVAHELNTPLSNILGYAQNALRHAEDPDLRENLAVIEAQSRRAAQIVRDMLTAARAPAPSLHPVDLSAVCAGFVRLVTPLTNKQGVRLTLEAPDGLPTVRADAAQVEQILFNLVFNAVQAGAKGIVLRLAYTARTLELTLSDDGPGLPPTVQARLFEPFVTTKPAGQGTGLGLAICQRLAREMGAELVCDFPGPGCVFALRFALDKPAPDSDEPQPRVESTAS